MMFSRLHAFSTYNISNLMMVLSRHSPTVSQGASVQEWFTRYGIYRLQLKHRICLPSTSVLQCVLEAIFGHLTSGLKFSRRQKGQTMTSQPETFHSQPSFERICCFPFQQSPNTEFHAFPLELFLLSAAFLPAATPFSLPPRLAVVAIFISFPHALPILQFPLHSPLPESNKDQLLLPVPQGSPSLHPHPSQQFRLSLSFLFYCSSFLTGLLFFPTVLSSSSHKNLSSQCSLCQQSHQLFQGLTGAAFLISSTRNPVQFLMFISFKKLSMIP